MTLKILRSVGALVICLEESSGSDTVLKASRNRGLAFSDRELLLRLAVSKASGSHSGIPSTDPDP